MTNKYIMFELDDEKIKVLADVISNKTAKVILEHLADKEASETEIANALKFPANTVNYNIKKLLEAGLIEKTKTYFWSVKGKKIPYYKVANKKIVISPKSSSNNKALLSALLATGIGALLIKLYTSNAYQSIQKTTEFASSGGAEILDKAAPSITPDAGNNVINSVSQMPEIWIWFLLGGIFALIIFMMSRYLTENSTIYCGVVS